MELSHSNIATPNSEGKISPPAKQLPIAALGCLDQAVSVVLSVGDGGWYSQPDGGLHNLLYTCIKGSMSCSLAILPDTRT